MLAIPPPSEFSAPSPFRDAEGHWAPLTQSAYDASAAVRSSGWYLPKILLTPWAGKRAFAAAVYQLESQCTPDGSIGSMHVRTFPGWSPSRIPRDLLLAHGFVDGRHFVGRREYHDERESVRWPENYVRHYILDFDVAPTRRFFEYVCRRVDEPVR